MLTLVAPTRSRVYKARVSMADMVEKTSETLAGKGGGDGGDEGLMSRVFSTTAVANEAQTVARVSHESHVLGQGF